MRTAPLFFTLRVVFTIVILRICHCFLHILFIVDVIEGIIGWSEHVAESLQTARQFSVGGDECVAPAVYMVEEFGTEGGVSCCMIIVWIAVETFACQLSDGCDGVINDHLSANIILHVRPEEFDWLTLAIVRRRVEQLPS